MIIAPLIGREHEIATLTEALQSPRAELIALYGRRRVGKTYLVRNVCAPNILFELTGLKDATLSEQLNNFSDTLSDTFRPPLAVEKPQNWREAFGQLKHYIETDTRSVKKVVFLDEFPWLDTAKSGFLQAFDHFWNNWASRRGDLAVVICGSAASWMIRNIVRNKGGLHNRLTRRIRLMPFNLHETEQLLAQQGIVLERYQILQLYMAMGGIPQYLMEVKSGESAAQTIDRLCFTGGGFLRHEFQDLYPALFDNAEKHLAVVRALSQKPYGMTRSDLLDACNLTSGGTSTEVLEELIESGFLTEYIPFGKSTRDVVFKLSDEYSLFYLRFIENSLASGSGAWLTKSSGPAWAAWSGQAFENICQKHVPQIKKALGIAAVYTETSLWRHKAKQGDTIGGAQVDLLFDRNDQCINLVEIKFSAQPFSITKAYAEELRNKRWVFMEKTGTRKTVFLTMLTTFGVKTNEHYLGLVQNQLDVGCLFEG